MATEAAISVVNLTKRFGNTVIWEDLTFDIPKGEITIILGPSGTGKSVLLKHLLGLFKPTSGHVYVDGKDIPSLKERELQEVRKKFGVLFQDGALFGSMNIEDNTAFPLREHTNKSESEIRRIVYEKLEIVGLADAGKKLPAEVSGGMRKRAGLARALVLNPEILLFDEPDSGLDPVRTAYLNELTLDLKREFKPTIVIVTHHIGTARTVPDNIGLIYNRHLATFGKREDLLESKLAVVKQFLYGLTEGPIGMSEEKDASIEIAPDETIEDDQPKGRKAPARKKTSPRSKAKAVARAR
jgi:phospholipid/cholesterol/gamma-HCH transport system ATP-binding protein